MSVILKLVKRGARFRILALGDENGCKLLEFMADEDVKRPAELAKLQRLLDRSAAEGPPHNKEKCRHLGNDLWEFKTGGGLRVIWFYDAGALIICTHGFEKQGQKTPRGEIRLALDLRDSYFEAKRLNQVREEP